MVHCKDGNGIDGMDLVQLEEVVDTQLQIGRGTVVREDQYLFDFTVHDIMAKNIEEICG